MRALCGKEITIKRKSYIPECETVGLERLGHPMTEGRKRKRDRILVKPKCSQKREISTERRGEDRVSLKPSPFACPLPPLFLAG